jgi:hypothetical protein
VTASCRLNDAGFLTTLGRKIRQKELLSMVLQLWQRLRVPSPVTPHLRIPFSSRRKLSNMGSKLSIDNLTQGTDSEEPVRR